MDEDAIVSVECPSVVCQVLMAGCILFGSEIISLEELM